MEKGDLQCIKRLRRNALIFTKTALLQPEIAARKKIAVWSFLPLILAFDTMLNRVKLKNNPMAK